MKTTTFLALGSIALLGCAVAACSSNGAPECTGETAGQALSVCSKGATLKGVDVSTYQGAVNWASVKSAGNTFAFVRVSDGANTSDNEFATNWPNAKKAGLIRGAYQFFRPGQDPTTQANLFVSKMQAAGGMVKGDLPAVLDLETADGQSNATVVAHALTWLSVIEQKTGIKPIVYTAAFMSSVIGTSFSKYQLWVANYGPTCPTMPSGWSAWEFWQDSSTGKVGGISGNVDTDIFNGDLVALNKLTIQSAPTTDAGTATDTDAGTSEPQGNAGGPTVNTGGAMGSAGQDQTSTPAPAMTSTPPSDPCVH